MRTVSLFAFGIVVTTSVEGSAQSPYFEEPDVEVAYSLFTEQPGDWFGWVAEDLGDIDGDGAPDFVTSAPFQTDAQGASTGKVYVYSGADGTLLASHVGHAGELLGYGASLAGDVDGDGVHDYVAGSLSRVVAWSGIDHEVIWEHVRPGEQFGFDVDTVGDVDGDGLDDVAVGAPAAAVHGPTSGAVHVLSGADGSVIWTRNGTENPDRLGSAVGRLGDVNRDGIPDLVAGARTAGLEGRGEAYVLSGEDGKVLHVLRPVGQPSLPLSTFATFHAAGGRDFDGDGVSDLFIGDYGASRDDVPGTGRAYVFSGRRGHRSFVFNAEQTGDGLGPGRLVSDADGDGRADVFVAGYTWGGGSAVGRAYLYGRRGRRLRTMTGTQPGALLGVDAAGIEDVDGDGVDDFVLTGLGVVHVILGHDCRARGPTRR